MVRHNNGSRAGRWGKRNGGGRVGRSGRWRWRWRYWQGCRRHGGVHSLGNSILPGGDGLRSHEVFWVNLGVIFIPDEFVLTVSKDLGPCSGIEVWEVINTGGNCSEPIIKDNMKLWGDGSSVQGENQGSSTHRIWAQSHEDYSRSSWFPTWKFLAIRNCLVQNIEWASPT